MNLTVPIPEDLATRLSADGEDLARRGWKVLGWKNTRPVAQRRSCGRSV
jgi:hypothetical protein